MCSHAAWLYVVRVLVILGGGALPSQLSHDRTAGLVNILQGPSRQSGCSLAGSPTAVMLARTVGTQALSLEEEAKNLRNLSQAYSTSTQVAHAPVAPHRPMPPMVTRCHALAAVPPPFVSSPAGQVCCFYVIRHPGWSTPTGVASPLSRPTPPVP